MAGARLMGALHVPAQGTPIPDNSDEGRVAAEKHAGLRCGGCGKRIQRGFEFVATQAFRVPNDLSGARAVRVERTMTCAGDDGCTFALEVAKTATAVKRVDAEFMFLDDPAIQKLIRGAGA
jgi:hypothetical protein